MMRSHYRPGTGVSAGAVIVAAQLVIGAAANAGNLAVVSTSPDLNGLNASRTTAITVNFNMPVQPASVTTSSFRVFGRWSGTAEGDFSFSNGDQTVTLTPRQPFSGGENVMVILSHDLAGADGSPMRAAGYSFKFWIQARPACLNFEELDVMSNTDGEQTRIYGTAGPDLNNDGFLDIVTINEVSADLRVFMNTADGTGLYHPWLKPPEAAQPEISPNETADFNNDGLSDLCVAATAADRVLVFLGQGDGTFGAAQNIVVGDGPLGVAVLDCDGDGDLDIINGNRNSNNLSRLLNNGAGVFGGPTFFEGGVNGEYGIASADMDRDGILDIVVGGNSSQTVRVMRGNGDGTFTPAAMQSCGGPVWQLGTGDVNGDGWEDVHTCNSFNNNGAIILGAGNGTLAPPQTEPAGGHAPATDLGDFDGDGDLDWLLSSFGGGIWRLYVNDGDGNFSLSQDFQGPNNPSCGAAMDIDNDGDLDIVLSDEIADVIILMENIVLTADTNCDLVVDVADLLAVINGWGPCDPGAPCVADLNGDGAADVSDLLLVINNWS